MQKLLPLTSTTLNREKHLPFTPLSLFPRGDQGAIYQWALWPLTLLNYYTGYRQSWVRGETGPLRKQNVSVYGLGQCPTSTSVITVLSLWLCDKFWRGYWCPPTSPGLSVWGLSGGLRPTGGFFPLVGNTGGLGWFGPILHPLLAETGAVEGPADIPLSPGLMMIKIKKITKKNDL